MAPQAAVTQILEPADEGDVMREQLEYLIEHAAQDVQCDCPECQRYLRVRTLLLEIFGEPQRPQVQEMPRFAKAA